MVSRTQQGSPAAQACHAPTNACCSCLLLTLWSWACQINTGRSSLFTSPDSAVFLQKVKIAEEETSAALNHAEKQIWTWSIILSFIFVFGWPLLALPAGVFSKASHTSIVKVHPIASQ